MAISQKKLTSDTVPWQVLENLMIMKNRWISLIGERLLDDKGNHLSYWRVERCDSVVIIPIYRHMFLLPAPVYRPGVALKTHDFPGGRHEKGRQPIETAHMILKRELGISTVDVQTMRLMNEQPWLVDSSFSNQKLHIFEAVLNDAALVDPTLLDVRCPIDQAETLLNKLVCLQCRCALLDWLHKHDKNERELKECLRE